MDTLRGVKRSRRQIKISQRLADSLQQEEVLSNVLETKSKNKVGGSLKSDIKSRSLAYQSEFTLAQLKLLDGSLLVKYFSTRKKLPTGLTQFKCQLLRKDKECTKVFVKRSEKECKVVLTRHLLEHIQLLSTKNTQWPKLYGKVRFYPCAKPSKHKYVKQKSECLKSKISFNTGIKTLPVSQPKIVEAQIKFLKTVDAESKKLKTQEYTPPKTDEYEPTIQEKARLFVEENKVEINSTDHVTNIVDIENQVIIQPKEALLKAVSLVPANTRQIDEDTNKINTRGHRKKVVENRNTLLEREKQETLRKCFSQQPAVVVSDLSAWSSPGKENVVVITDDDGPSLTGPDAANISETDTVLNADAVSSSSSPVKVSSRQIVLNDVALKQKYLPTILRRKKRDCIEKSLSALECNEVMSEIVVDNVLIVPPDKQGQLQDKLNPQEDVNALRHDHNYTPLIPVSGKLTSIRSLSTSLQQACIKNKSKDRTKIRIQHRNEKTVSSKRVESSTDPEIKALAIKLINELKYRKPKETMVCTEKNVQGQSSYIVQDFYTCEICGKNFTAPNSLYGHYRGHAGIKPYRCKVCGKTFTRSHSLNYHSMIHEGSARFQCAYCDRKFRHPTHYKCDKIGVHHIGVNRCRSQIPQKEMEHLNRHTGAEPYSCSECSRKFKTRNTLRRHVKAKHNKVLSRIGAIPKNAKLINQEGDGSGNRTFFIEN